ncbi:hypothetical protein EDD85DRAFT_941620 [Armillaria nabsnona]|nr:hypothetical protein EDD85DRAFT_941620 [Armillaria nabsnona]
MECSHVMGMTTKEFRKDKYVHVVEAVERSPLIILKGFKVKIKIEIPIRRAFKGHRLFGKNFRNMEGEDLEEEFIREGVDGRYRVYLFRAMVVNEPMIRCKTIGKIPGTVTDRNRRHGEQKWELELYSGSDSSYRERRLVSVDIVVLDALLTCYMDKTPVANGVNATRPQAQHKKSTENDDRLQFWIANPASLCWLTRTVMFLSPDDSYEGFDERNFGVS